MKKNYIWLKVFLGTASILSTIEQGASMRPVDKSLPINRELLDAASSGDRARVESLLKQGADIRIIDTTRPKRWPHDKNLTSIDWQLLRVVSSGDRARIESLLKQGADAGAVLFAAIQSGDINAVNFLVDLKIDANATATATATATRGIFVTPLNFAIHCGNVPIIKRLTNEHINIDAPDFCGRSSLIYTSMYGKIDLARWLLSNGANVNTTSYFGHSPVFFAAGLDETDMLIYLVVNRGANVRTISYEGKTPLHRAIDHGKIGAVKFLMPLLCTDINAIDGTGETLLTFAIKVGRWGTREEHMEIIEHLIHLGADLNKANGKGETPMHCAIIMEHTRLIDSLLKRGIDINAVRINGLTPMYFAVSHDWSLHKIRFLMPYCTTDVNMPNEDGKTLLNFAVELRKWEIIKFLIGECKVNVNMPNRNGETPLHCAVKSGEMVHATAVWQVEIIKFLLKHGADIYAYNPDGETVLHCAIGEMKFGTFYRLINHSSIKSNENNRYRFVNMVNKFTGETPLDFALRIREERGVASLPKRDKLKINCNKIISSLIWRNAICVYHHPEKPRYGWMDFLGLLQN
ncbi:MAG: ankyrin repeat domain-containing protein [Holosporaceae bacterium]|jgi:ankyrin repeat protein|nr:ankyrin repeat domain-containing protein [Holosporaceae bacterium]